MIVKEDKLDEARNIFNNSDVNITIGRKRHLGTVIGSNEYREEYVKDSVNDWNNQLVLSSIDLILTNRKYSFKHTSSHEMGLSDHHHMIYTMLKSSFINIEPKLLNYRDYKNFNFGNFQEDLSKALLICRNSYDEFESAFITALDKHAPKKKKWLRGNNKPHITKPLRQAIMKQSRLKDKANKTKLLNDIRNYKKQ